MRSIARLIGCAVTAALMISGSVSVTSAEDVIFPTPKPIISPFSKINIQTSSDHLVEMSYNGICFRSTSEKDKETYDEFFSKTPVMDGNYYADGIARKKDRIDSSFNLWNGRWKKPKYDQAHYQGSFLIFVGSNPNPFAHAVDGFISSEELARIMDDAEEDFNDHSGLLGEYKATIQRLATSGGLGYSQANLDFTGDTVGYFVKNFNGLRSVNLMQDTYMHQLSFLSYNWGVETLLGRTVGHMNKPVMAKNAIESYQSMGYYPFKMKTKEKYGEKGEMVEFLTLLKPVNPLQAVFDIRSLNGKIALDIHLMSYFSTLKVFNLKLMQEVDGEVRELFAKEYEMPELSPFTLLIDLHEKYKDQLIWLKMDDVDGILDPILLPIQVTVH